MVTSFVFSVARPASPGDPAPVTRFGGLPTDLGALVWPRCKGCNSPMRFCGQLAAHPEHTPLKRWALLSWFMCDNPATAGRCATDDPKSGCNALLPQVTGDVPPRLLPAPEHPAAAPLAEWCLGAVREVDERDAPDDPVEWTEADQEAVPEGPKLLGQTWWLELDERPACPRCNLPMRFLGQVPEDLDADPSLYNFGEDGEGYFFVCPRECSPNGTAFLWQSV